MNRVSGLILATVIAFAFAGSAFAGTDKITICHAAGQEGTTQFVTLNLPPAAVYGPGGHFNENGTPAAGHEQDYLGACIEDEPSTEPSVVPSVSPSPTPEVTPTPTPEPTPTPSVDVTPAPSLDVPTGGGPVASPRVRATMPPTDTAAELEEQSGLGALLYVLLLASTATILGAALSRRSR